MEALQRDLRAASQEANRKFLKGLLASIKALGADTNALEEKLNLSILNFNMVKAEVDTLMKENPEVKQLNHQLGLKARAIMCQPQVISIICTLLLEALKKMIQMVQVKLDVVETPTEDDGVKNQVVHLKITLRDTMQKLAAICQNISPREIQVSLESSTKRSSLEGAVMSLLEPFFGELKKSLKDILRAFKALTGEVKQLVQRLDMLERRLAQLSIRSMMTFEFLVLSQFELALVLSAGNRQTRKLAKSLQDGAVAICNSQEVEQLIIQTIVDGSLLTVQTLLLNMED